MRQTVVQRPTTTRTLAPSAVGLVGLISLVVLSIVIAGAMVARSTSASASALGAVVHGDPEGPAQGRDQVTVEDGVLPDGVTVSDDRYPGVTHLDPGLLHALRAAASDAARRGITFYVNSGWRSPAYQEQLLRDAVAEYGSVERAEQWVATAATSPHVSGNAVDLGHADATAWLSAHGAAYGLCQIYRNEPWHYELRPQALDQGCPRMYADPTHDPRMRS